MSEMTNEHRLHYGRCEANVKLSCVNLTLRRMFINCVACVEYTLQLQVLEGEASFSRNNNSIFWKIVINLRTSSTIDMYLSETPSNKTLSKNSSHLGLINIDGNF